MRRFELLEPRSVEEAVRLLIERPDAKLIGGGTALLILVKHGVYVPTTLINLKKVPGLGDIRWDPQDGLRIGALASIREVEQSPLVREHFPILASACHVVANIRIRNLATIGGNLAHADYQSDPPSALLALDAHVELVGRDGPRTVELADFLIGSYETALEADEILTAIVVPPAAAWRGSYLKFTTRSSEDRPAAGISALLRLRDGQIADARLVVGAISPTPVRVEEAETLAAGAEPNGELFAAMAEAARRAVEPIADLRGSANYKRQLVGVLAERALAQAMEAPAS